MKTRKSARPVKSEEQSEEAAVAVPEPVSRTGEWTPPADYQPQDQSNTRQNAVTVIAELRGQEGRWHLTRLA